MNADDKVKEMVKQKYGEIALQEKETNAASCCGAGGCSTEIYNIMSDDYEGLKGYNADADLGLGCGLPTQFAKIKKGDVVIDAHVTGVNRRDFVAGYSSRICRPVVARPAAWGRRPAESIRSRSS